MAFNVKNVSMLVPHLDYALKDDEFFRVRDVLVKEGINKRIQDAARDKAEYIHTQHILKGMQDLELLNKKLAELKDAYNSETKGTTETVDKEIIDTVFRLIDHLDIISGIVFESRYNEWYKWPIMDRYLEIENSFIDEKTLCLSRKYYRIAVLYYLFTEQKSNPMQLLHDALKPIFFLTTEMEDYLHLKNKIVMTLTDLPGISSIHTRKLSQFLNRGNGKFFAADLFEEGIGNPDFYQAMATYVDYLTFEIFSHFRMDRHCFKNFDLMDFGEFYELGDYETCKRLQKETMDYGDEAFKTYSALITDKDGEGNNFNFKFRLNKIFKYHLQNIYRFIRESGRLENEHTQSFKDHPDREIIFYSFISSMEYIIMQNKFKTSFLDIDSKYLINYYIDPIGLLRDLHSFINLRYMMSFFKYMWLIGEIYTKDEMKELMAYFKLDDERYYLAEDMYKLIEKMS